MSPVCEVEDQNEVSKELEVQNRASELKKQGNDAYINKNYEKAIELYTSAIDLAPSNAAFYTNRSQAYFQLEGYGSALNDASKAIEINKSFAKGWWRRANAYIALNQISKAVSDLEVLKNLEPSDTKVSKFLAHCKEHVMRARMRDALSQATPTQSAFDLLDISAELSKGYTGPVLPDDFSKLDKDSVMGVIKYFKDGHTLHHTQTAKILIEAAKYFKSQPNVVKVDKPDVDCQMTICGDVHGQYYDFLNIFEQNGYPSPTNAYLFNGDFVDRGAWSLETVTILLLFKLLYPDSFFMNRGNHEVDTMNRMYGFEGEVLSKNNGDRGRKLYNAFKSLFEHFPLATIIGDKIFVAHGGVPKDGNVTIEEIQKIDRFTQPPEQGIMCDLLWADPHEGNGLLPSDRGTSNKFGKDVTDRFLALNDLKCVVRSHEMKHEGYEVQQQGSCVTIFSAPNYCDSMMNKGAFIKVNNELEFKYQQFNCVQHPACNAMQYSNLMNPYC